MGGWTPSIVPGGIDQTVYLVLNDFGSLGHAYLETDEEKADLETVIASMLEGQYSNPVKGLGAKRLRRCCRRSPLPLRPSGHRRAGASGRPYGRARNPRPGPSSGWFRHE